MNESFKVALFDTFTTDNSISISIFLHYNQELDIGAPFFFHNCLLLAKRRHKQPPVISISSTDNNKTLR